AARPSTSRQSSAAKRRAGPRSYNRPASRPSKSGCRDRRLRALDLDAEAEPLVRPVVPDGAMLGAAVIPEGDRMLAPVEAHLPLGALDVLEQELEQRIALHRRQIVDVRGLAAIDVDELAAGPGMHRDDRVRAHGIDGLRALVEELGAIVRGAE